MEYSGGNVTLARSAKGLTSARLGDGASSITQTLGALTKGTYSVSAWVEIDPTLDSKETYPRGKRETSLSTTVSGSPAVTNIINSSPCSTRWRRIRRTAPSPSV
ncbi:hypothetical protein NHF46_05060 [Arthrobacter alpinus]|nr:hypothetical protein [Arthrobacter alpinus]